MKAETDDGCSCPRCHDHIPEEFYCRNCGYVPDWRQRALIEKMSTEDFEPERYADEYRERALAMIEKKVKGQEIKAVAPPKARPEVAIERDNKALFAKLLGQIHIWNEYWDIE
ncbi:MAG TPA: hypothetical protein VF977_11715 [Candidatus Binatia bacterium]